MFYTEYFESNNIYTVPSGVHFIEKPIVLRGENIVVRGEENATLCATRALHDAKWTYMGDGIYFAKIPYEADALYINGYKYRMARYPKYNPDEAIFHGYSADCISPEKVRAWHDPRGGYIHAMHKHEWGGYSYKITGKDDEGKLTYIGGWQNNRQLGMHSDFRFAENIFEELTEPGEWFFDSINKQIYVIPREKDELATAEIAINSTFFIVENSKNITFENINFERSSRTFMQTVEPLLRSDWTIYRGGAVHIKNSSGCNIKECRFSDIGSNAVFVDGNCSDVSISKCMICDIGGSGICFVGSPDSVRSPLFEYSQTQSIHSIDMTPGPQSDNYPKSCHADNCLIYNIGTVEKQSAGIEISMAYKISVTNCSIYDTPRAGINISEGTFGGHLIDGCDVFDTVKETGDHGSFNSWGRDRFWHADELADEDAWQYALLDCISPITIRNSRFRCDRGWDIDLDDGSSNYLIYNNLCLNGGIKLREGFFRRVYNNITVNNTIHFHVWYPNSGDIVENNVVFAPYRPVGMPKKWGKRVDGNVLYCKGIAASQKAEPLSALSHDDEASIIVDCKFLDPDKGDYTVTADIPTRFENISFDFGVKYAPLKAIAKAPSIPPIKCAMQAKASKIDIVYGISVKNIETDGEMSAYGTAGKNGVLVLNTEADSDAYKKGLRAHDVIVRINGKEIASVQDLRGEADIYSKSILVLRNQVLAEL